MSENNFHIGTSGWSYKDWKGIFYPPKLKSTDWLSFYAQTFDITEINSSFYRLPSRETVAAWVEKVPPGFLFCPKMSRFLTHFKKLKDPEEPLERFFGVFEPMLKNMGPILIQLPRMVPFNYDTAEHFYKLLKEQYSQQSFAMEIRHDAWLSPDSIQLMRRFDIAFVISQSGDHFPYAEIITNKNIYFRFHGPGSLYDSCYEDAALKKYARLFKKWMQQGHELWIFFNNDYYGYGIRNGLRLRELLHHRPVARRLPPVKKNRIANIQTSCMIRKLKSGEYRLYSRKKNAKTGKRRNLGTFSSLAAAKKHEKEIQYFKRH